MAIIKNKVIRACAGSGKTYALIQRLLALLEAGVAPGEIIAITFTKKAAAEIKERLFNQLRVLAKTEKWASQAQQRLLQAQSSRDVVNIYTFHGWFATLLMNKSSSRQWLGMPEIIETDADIRQEAWLQWNKKNAQSKTVQDILIMCSPFGLEELMTQTLVKNSNAWKLYNKQYDTLLKKEKQCLGDAKNKLEPLLIALNEQTSDKNKTAQNLKKTIDVYLNDGKEEELEKIIFKADGNIRVTISKNAQNNDTLPLLENVATYLMQLLNHRDTVETIELNQRLQPLLDDYLAIYSQLKSDKNGMTFDDLEYQVLLESEQNNNINDLLYRTQCHYKHILIDEFQDTSPIQWQILYNWLQSTVGSDSEPTIFIVGDPKQAIYGFRYSDSRLMTVAEDFLTSHFTTEIHEEAVCRRCAPAIIDMVNTVFANNKNLPAFSAHQTARGVNSDIKGRVEWHDHSNAGTKKEERKKNKTPRNPLKTPLSEKNENYQNWANAIVKKIKSMVNVWQIQDEGKTRLVTNEDILILFPQKTHLSMVTDALGQSNVPYQLLGNSNQFTREHFVYKDIIALMSALLSPYNEIALAQLLRSPLFAMSDEMLLRLCEEKNDSRQTLWTQLMTNNHIDNLPAKQMLLRWQGWLKKGTLPVHDFLSCVFEDGQFLSRYQSAVPISQYSEIKSIINGFLDFSLIYKGGSYPLVQNFLDDVQSQSLQSPLASNTQGVKLMTIHGAKGLEAPVVILADTSFGDKFKGNKQSMDCLIEWLPTHTRPTLFMLKPKKYFKRAYVRWYEKKQEQAQKEDANLSYVALTRAKQALIVFSQRRSEVADELENYFQEAKEYGDDLSGVVAFAEQNNTVATLEPIKTGVFQKSLMGEKVHQIISLLLMGLDKKNIRQLQEDYNETNFKTAQTLLKVSDLQALLQECERLMVEQEFIEDGKLIRIDLLIFHQKSIWIIDFKTGKLYDYYKAQLLNYKAVVEKIYPDHTIQTALLIGERLQKL